MQSKEQKILKLLKSEDQENQNLGNLTLQSYINKDNALYFYLATDSIKEKLDAKSIDLITTHAGLNAKQFALENLSKIMETMQQNKPHLLTINLFFAQYNDYLYGILSMAWSKSDRVETRKQINALEHGKRFNPKLEQDL
jgi:hypothetical protein